MCVCYVNVCRVCDFLHCLHSYMGVWERRESAAREERRSRSI